MHELGAASVHFGYRIVALRKNFENIRMEDHTKDLDPAKLSKARGKTTQSKGDMHRFTLPAKLAPIHPIAQTKSKYERDIVARTARQTCEVCHSFFGGMSGCAQLCS